MKTISRQKQLEMMEIVACASGARTYEEVREQMFDAFNSEYGRGCWDFVPITDKQKKEFLEWLCEDDV